MTKFELTKSIAGSKLTFDERVVVHHVVNTISGKVGAWGAGQLDLRAITTEGTREKIKDFNLNMKAIIWSQLSYMRPIWS